MIDDLEPPFELADIVRASECPPDTAERVELMQASDPEVAERLLDRAFEALDACARDFLLGNASPDVAAADLAWQRKDHRTVHALLDPIRDALDATHRRRVDFSARRLQQD